MKFLIVQLSPFSQHVYAVLKCSMDTFWTYLHISGEGMLSRTVGFDLRRKVNSVEEM
jgi:hypothetical protein